MEHTAELIWGLLVLCIDFSNSNADFLIVVRKILSYEGEKSG